MARYEVSFIAPVFASKTLIVDAATEDEAYNTAFGMIEEPFYSDLTKWELTFDDSIQCDGINEIEVETTSVTRS